MCEDYDLWRCGVCGEIRQGNWGLLPVVQPDGRRRVVCPECRDDHPELIIAQDGELYADYPPPLVDDGHLPFGLDDWLRGDG